MQKFSAFSAADPQASVDFEVYRKTETALRERERELSQLVDMVPSHLWRLTPDGEPIYFNKRMVDYLGLDVDGTDQPGITRLEALIVTTVHPDDQGAFRDAMRTSLTTGEPFALRYRLRRRDGAYRWMSSRAEPMRDGAGVIVQWYGLCHDIDDQIQADATMRHSEQQLRQIVDTVPVAIWSFTSDGKITYVSKQNLEHLGLSDLDFEDFARISQEVVHPDDSPAALHASSEGFRTGTAFVARYRRLVNGAYRWTEGRAGPLRDPSGAIVEWYAVSMDVDDEVRAQEALRRSEQQLRELVDALPTQIWAAMPDGEPSYLNRRLAEYVGLTLQDLDVPDASRLQTAIQGSVHPDDAVAVGAALAHAFATGEPFVKKYRQRRADGVYRWITGRAEPLRDATGDIVQWYGVSFDIDDDVRTQEELRRTQERLAVAAQAASLAELSASIAHEVNQPLAAVVANSHASQRWLATDPPNLERAKVAVERVIRDANSAADVVSRVRALFKQSRTGRTATRLDGVIAEARALLAEEALLRRVRIDVDIEPGLPPVALDRVQIQQVLINLMRNGIEAMSGIAEDRVLKLRMRRAGEMVEIDVSDSGPGMEFPERMFEPFFTTKEHGMGMGLAICRTIVESHGGRLWADKNEPRGARLSFSLPAEATNE